MIKRTAVLMIVVLCVGCGDIEKPPLRAWLVGSDTGQEYSARIGVMQDQLEIGIGGSWWIQDDPHQVFTTYLVQHLLEPDKPVLTLDTPADAKILELGQPYIGVTASLDLDEDGGMYGPIAGVIMEVGGVKVVTEYQYRTFNGAMKSTMGDSSDAHTVLIGPLFEF